MENNFEHQKSQPQVFKTQMLAIYNIKVVFNQTFANIVLIFVKMGSLFAQNTA
jgi:hypothetical protein